ncbi:NAD-dependent epimerase/dehydratase family protein [Pararhizobium mangrovi]|nr:NAD-dependent epimerase/dehydratase family protein [Pararhizobium mangrovi]
MGEDGERGRVLVTGVSGFIGRHLVREFLEHGYAVRGTVRDDAKVDPVRAGLAKEVDVSRLEFALADLTQDEGWLEAARDTRFVVHAASPFPLRQPKDPNVLVRPAVDGTMRVLKAAVAAGAERFVQTSSIAAIYPGHSAKSTTIDESFWADLGSEAASAYVLSKTLAERTARDFVESDKPAIDFVSVNPGFVLGPVPEGAVGSSADLIASMLNGRIPVVPRLRLSVVDVRDVATAHRLAIERGRAGGRYIAVAGSMWLREMGEVLRRELGERGRRASRFELPDWALRGFSKVVPSLRSIVPELDNPITFDTATSERDLGLTFIAPEEALLATARSLVEQGLVR